MSQPVIAVFDTSGEASAALARMQREGVPRSAITVMTSEPLRVETGEKLGHASRIPMFAICGGLVGAVCAIALTVITSRRLDLSTGGMPIVAPWAFGIIVFELTALGAILATLGRMVFEARLARAGAFSHYDESVSDGRILVTVSSPDEHHRRIAEKVLRPIVTPDR